MDSPEAGYAQLRITRLAGSPARPGRTGRGRSHPLSATARSVPGRGRCQAGRGGRNDQCGRTRRPSRRPAPTRACRSSLARSRRRPASRPGRSGPAGTHTIGTRTGPPTRAPAPPPSGPATPCRRSRGYRADLHERHLAANRSEEVQYATRGFALGVRGGILTGFTPSLAKMASKAPVNLASRSRIRNRKEPVRSPRSMSRLRACWAVHAPSG